MRSRIYQELYPDDLMMKVFGKLTPSESEKTSYFSWCWYEWKDNVIRFVPGGNRAEKEIKDILKGLGFKDMFDFQIRGGQVRVKSSSDLAIAKLALSSTFGVKQ